ADTEESLYALKLSTVPTAEGQTVLANWIRVDGNPVTNFRDVADADGDGNTTELVPFVSGTSGSINTLNSQALADWSLSNASQFINPTDIAEDASSPGTFYFVAEGASGYGELYKLTLDSNGIIPNVTNAAEPAQIASDVTLVLQGTAANSFDSLTVDANGDVVLHGNERSIFRYSVTDQSITTLGDESTIGTGVVKAAGAAEAYLSSSVQDKLVLTYSNAPAFDSDSVEFTVSEDAEEGVVVGSVTATDLTPGDTVTYSITDLDPDEDNNPAFIIDTSTGEITVNDADDLALLDVFNLTVTATDSTGLTDTTEVEITVEPSDAPGETETPGIFQCSDIFKLVASITSFNIDIDVNFGLFFVDGADGNIGGILPDAAGYKAAAAGRALSLLGLVAQANTTNNGGFNFAPGQLKKILGLQSAASLTKARFTDQFFFGFLSVNTVSIGDLFALANGSGILDSLLESISLSTENDGGSVQDDGEGGFTISFGKLSFSITFDADAVDESFGGLVGIDLDNDGDNEEIVDEVIAKCDDAGEYTISGSIFREAAYNNTIGFFFVNVDGAVLDSSGAEVATPDDLTNYKAAIVANLITENSSAVQYQVSNNTTIEFSFSITTVTAAVYVLPVLAVQGDFSTFSDIYYPVIAANSDRVDHMKFQGAGASGNGRFFGFEDLASNVSDNDFDDFIIQVNVQTA
ncbi:MAG: hypothetical protein RLZZ435_3647, partial [Cyanobacteriota bacterium]